MTPLLLALLLSQSRDVDRTIQIYENWNLREHGTSATVSAPLRGLGCLPTGGVSGSAGVTTTRATGAALAEPAGAGQPYTFFDDLPNTVSHAAFNGTTLVEQAGTTWAQQGTVPQVAGAGAAPPGGGAFSSANYYLAGGLSTPSTDFYICSVFVNPTTNQGNPISIGQAYSVATNQGGAAILRGGSGFIVGYVNGALINETLTALPTGLPTVTCVGRTGTTGVLKSATLNGSSTLYRSAATTTLSGAAAAQGGRIGRYASLGDEFLDVVYETLVVYATPSESLFDRIFARASQRLKALQTCGNNTLAVTNAGAEIYAAGTNSQTNSETMTTGTAANAGWALDTCTATTVTNPPFITGAGQWSRIDNAGNSNGSLVTSQAIGATTVKTFSAWAWKSTPGLASMLTSAPDGLTSTTCACGRSDGGACTATNQSPSANYCKGVFPNIGLAPVRIWVTSTSASGTSGAGNLVPGELAVSVGQTYFSGAQTEPGAYPTPYIPTTAAAATRNASLATMPFPANIHLTNRFCVGATASKSVLTPGGMSPVLLANGSGDPNSFDLSINAGASTLAFRVFDSAGVALSAGWVFTGGWANGQALRILGCNDNGVVSLYVDGRKVGTTTGAGAGVWTATQATLKLGNETGSSVQFWDGSIRDVKVCPNDANPQHCN